MKSALQRTGSAAIVALALAKPAASTASAPVVPWLPLQPAKASASPPLAPPCRAGELAAQLALNGATGSLVGDVELRNAGTTPCPLLGHPTISFTGAAARQEPWPVRELAASPAPPDVLADPPGSLRSRPARPHPLPSSGRTGAARERRPPARRARRPMP